MVKKKIDNRIRVMIENGVKLGHRTMFIIVGDKARDQVCFYFLSLFQLPINSINNFTSTPYPQSTSQRFQFFTTLLQNHR